MVDGLRVVGVDGQVLTDDVAPVDEPRGARVAVDRLRRPVARRDVRRCRRPCRRAARRRCARRRRRLREGVEAELVGRRVLTGPLGVAAVVADAGEELLVAAPVRVGEHEVGALAQLRAQLPSGRATPISSTSDRPSSSPAAAASTMPSPSPASSTGCSVGAACTIGIASLHVEERDRRRVGGVGRDRAARVASIAGTDGRGAVRRAGAEAARRVEARRAAGRRAAARAGAGCGVSKRSYCEVGAQRDGADVGEPRERRERVGLEGAVLDAGGRARRAGSPTAPSPTAASRARRTGRSVSPGVIGSMVSPQRYAAKSQPGISSTRVASPSRCIAAMASCPVRGDVLGRGRGAARGSRCVQHRRRAPRARARRPRTVGQHARRARGASAATPAATRPARPEDEERHRARRVAQREPGRGVAGERLEQRAVRARVVVGPRADARRPCRRRRGARSRRGGATA